MIALAIFLALIFDGYPCLTGRGKACNYYINHSNMMFEWGRGMGLSNKKLYGISSFGNVF